MTEQNKQSTSQESTENISEQEQTTQGQAPPQETPEEHQDRLKETTEKIWGSTKHAWSTAAFKASQYKKIVQKKIDLSAIHKKIGAAHADLGKVIDELREEGKKNILNIAEVKELFQQLDSLKATAAALEEELENISTSEPEEPS